MPVERRGWVTNVGSGQPATGGNPMINGRRQPSLGGTSRMMREYHVRICEGLGVKLPGSTRQVHPVSHRGRGPGIRGQICRDNAGQRQAKSRKGVQRRSVADLVSESLTRGNCPVDAVVISTSRKGERPV